MSERVYIEVPFAEKDDAKALGAWWDPHARSWYVPADKDSSPFLRWLGNSDGDPLDDALILQPPVYSVESKSGCWRCDRVVPVVSIGCECFCYGDGVVPDGDSTFYTLSGIRWLSGDALVGLRNVNRGYRKRFSKTADEEYFMNHCTCAAQLGDFYLHSEPGGAFSPLDAGHAGRMRLRILSRSQAMRVSGSAGTSSPCLIWEHAQRVGQ